MIDAGNLAALPVLGGIESLCIFADNDPAGVRGATTCCRRWREAGREAAIVTPDANDWNDEVRDAE